MELLKGQSKRNIKEVIADYPGIGNILEKYSIGCTKCSIGSCLLQDVVAVHYLGAETDAKIEEEINAYLADNREAKP